MYVGNVYIYVWFMIIDIFDEVVNQNDLLQSKVFQDRYLSCKLFARF